MANMTKWLAFAGAGAACAAALYLLDWVKAWT